MSQADMPVCDNDAVSCTEAFLHIPGEIQPLLSAVNMFSMLPSLVAVPLPIF